MVNPQRENGHVDFANEIVEALARIRISGEAGQVLWVVFRKTYGWNKTKDKISLSQFQNMTGLPKIAVCKAIKKLLQMNIITKEGNARSLFTKKGNDTIPTYAIQKDYEKWQPLPKKVALKHVTKEGNLTLPKKQRTKDTITKDNIYTNFLSEQFGIFKKAYPKWKSPMDVKNAWAQLWDGTKSKYYAGKLNNELMQTILSSIEAYIKTPGWQSENGKWIPYPASWLRDHCWEDDIEIKPIYKADNTEDDDTPTAWRVHEQNE